MMLSFHGDKGVKIMIVDLGSAQHTEGGICQKNDSFGTGSYVAPEILGTQWVTYSVASADSAKGEVPYSESKYDAYAADFWAVGIIFYALVAMTFPWNLASATEDIAFHLYVHKREHKMTPYLQYLSRYTNTRVNDRLQDLIYGLLEVCPCNRYSGDQCDRQLLYAQRYADITLVESCTSEMIKRVIGQASPVLPSSPQRPSVPASAMHQKNVLTPGSKRGWDADRFANSPGVDNAMARKIRRHREPSISR